MVNGIFIVDLNNGTKSSEPNKYERHKKKNKDQKRIVYCILTYDIANIKRLPKMLKLCRQFLHWVQNSTFEGELSEVQLDRLYIAIKNIIEIKEDSVLIYTLRDRSLIKKKVIGIEKNTISNFI